jgi:restriction endonuclease S subunit
MNRYKKSNQSLKDRVNLGDICDILIGETPRKTNKHFYGGKNLFVRIKDLNQEIIKSTDVTLTDEGINQAKVKSLKKHTLLFSFKLTIAKVAFAGRKLYTCESIAGLIPKDNRVLAPYLYHILPKLDYSPYINRGAKGQELKRSVLKTIQIPLPPLPIQKKLVRKLTCQEAKRKHFLKQAEKIRQIKNTTIKGLLK